MNTFNTANVVEAKEYAKTIRAILKELYPSERFAVRVDAYAGPRAIVITLKGGKVFHIALQKLLWSIIGNTLTSENQRVYQSETGFIAPDVQHVVCNDMSISRETYLGEPVVENSKTLMALKFVAEL